MECSVCASDWKFKHGQWTEFMASQAEKPSAGFETHWPGNHSSAFSFSHDNPPTSIIPLELLPVEQTLVHDVLELV